MNGECRRGDVATCAGCLGWGLLNGRSCSTCYSFAQRHDTGECGACGRTTPVKRGYCRLCWIEANRQSAGRTKSLRPVLEHLTHQQLFFVGMRRPHQRQPRPANTCPTELDPPRPSAGPVRIDRWLQPRLFDVPRDFSYFDKRRHANPSNPWLIRARRVTSGLGEARGWGRWTQFQVNQALTIVLSHHCHGDTVRYSELFPVVRRRHLNVKRTIEVLDHLGVFEDDRVPTLDAWLSRRLADLAPAIRSDVEAWAHNLVERGPRSRPRSRRTLQGYLDHIQPVLTDWSLRHDHLREVTHDDVLTARDARQGATRETMIVAMRSLFHFCKHSGRVFRDPTSRVQTPKRPRRVPLPLNSAEIGQAVAAAVTTADRVILVLAGIHAARPSNIRHLLLDDIDLANRRFTIAGQVRPLDEPTRRTVLRWLDDRRSRWPNTTNPHLLVNPNTALGTRPVGHASITKAVRGLTATVERLRVDRQLDEALINGAEPLQLAAVFGLDEGTAIRYADAARQLLTSRAEQHEPALHS